MSIMGARIGSVLGAFVGSKLGGFGGGVNERILINIGRVINRDNLVWSIPKTAWTADGSIHLVDTLDDYKLPIPFAAGTFPTTNEPVDPDEPTYRVGIFKELWGLGGLLKAGHDLVICRAMNLGDPTEQGPLVLAFDASRQLVATHEVLPFARLHWFYGISGYEAQGMWRWQGRSLFAAGNIPASQRSATENLVNIAPQTGNGEIAENLFNLPAYGDTPWASGPRTFGTNFRETFSIDMGDGTRALVIFGRVNEGPYYNVLEDGVLDSSDSWVAIPNDKTGTPVESDANEYALNYTAALAYRFSTSRLNGNDYRTQILGASTYVPKANALVFASGDQARASMTTNRQVIAASLAEGLISSDPDVYGNAGNIRFVPPPQGGPHSFAVSYRADQLTAASDHILSGQSKPTTTNNGIAKRAAPYGSIKYFSEEDRLHQVFGYNGYDEEDATYYLHKIQPTTDINDRWDITDSINLNTLFSGRTYGTTISGCHVQEWTKDGEPVVVISSYTDANGGSDNQLDQSGIDIIVMSADWTTELYHVRHVEDAASTRPPIVFTQVIE